MRSILDPCLFNKFTAHETRFHMLIVNHVLKCVPVIGWHINLKDTYFHVPIIPPHTGNRAFPVQFSIQPFFPSCYSLAPRIFSKCVDTALVPLRRKGIRLLFCLNHMIVMVSFREGTALHTVELGEHLLLLSSPITGRRALLFSNIQSLICIQHQSKVFPSKAGSSQRSPVTHRASQSGVSSLCLLGMMSTSHVMVPLALLHIRPRSSLSQEAYVNCHFLQLVLSCWKKPTQESYFTHISVHRCFSLRAGRNVSISSCVKKKARASISPQKKTAWSYQLLKVLNTLFCGWRQHVVIRRDNK